MIWHQFSSRAPSTELSNPSVELFSAFWNEGYYLCIYLYPGCRPSSSISLPSSVQVRWMAAIEK
jgi:hypothetical protein